MNMSEKLKRIKNGFHTVSFDKEELTRRISIGRLMNAFRIRGVSVAISDHFKIVCAKGYGMMASSAFVKRALLLIGLFVHVSASE